MQILWIILLIAAVIIAITAGISSSTDHLARAKEAQAAIEANRTAQIATSGLAINSVVMTILVVFLVIVVVGLLALVGYLFWRNMQRSTIMQPVGKWAPGPNARWGRIGSAPREQLPSTQTNPNDAMGQMVQLMLLRYLSEMGSTNSLEKPAQPRLYDDQTAQIDDDDIVIWR